MTYKKLTIAALLLVAVSLVVPTALADEHNTRNLKQIMDGVLDRIDALEQNAHEVTIEVAPAEIQIVGIEGIQGETGPQGEQGIQGETGEGEAFDGDADSITHGVLDIDRLPVGVGSQEISSGDHIHSSLEATVSSLESTVSTLEARILTLETAGDTIPFTMVVNKEGDGRFKEGDELRISGTVDPDGIIEIPLEIEFPSWGIDKHFPSVDVDGNWLYTVAMDDHTFQFGDYTVSATVGKTTLTDTFSYDFGGK